MENAKKIVLLLFCILLIGCEDKAKTVNEIDSYTSVIEIEGCEYIRRASKLAHKGNCNNKIHIYNK